MSKLRALTTIIALVVLCTAARASDEVALYNASGEAVAYIVVDDELPIYTWDGEPVAYLVPDYSKDYDVYDFDGHHIGWFVQGILRDGDGNAACAVKEAVRNVAIAGIKGVKSIKPIKSIRAIAPIRPIFSLSWAKTACEQRLAPKS